MPDSINSIQMSQESLSVRAVKSGFWVFLLRISQVILQIIKLIVLARIINPHDFGLMGIALLTMAILETFSATGFQAALIQKKEDIKSYLDIAWTALVLRGFALFALLYLIAPYAAVFFNEPKAAPIIQVVGISVIFKALTNIGVIYFRKDLQFSKEVFCQLSGTLADFITAISVVLVFRNVWAIVFGLLAGNFARLIVSYLIHPYRPRIELNYVKAKELFGFGKWVLGSTILIFLITQGDDIFVGKLLGVTALGFYQLAYGLSNLPATEITRMISQVTFPAYSKLQDNLPRLREAYLKVLQVTAFLSFPIAGLIFVLAPDFTKIFLGEKWMPMVPAMRVLTIWGVIRAIISTMGPLFYSLGEPRILTKLQFLNLLLLVILIYPLSLRWGIAGTSLAVVVSTSVQAILTIYTGVKHIGCTMNKFCKIIAPFLGSTCIMILCTVLLNIYLFEARRFLEICLFILLGGGVYLGMMYLFDKFTSNSGLTIIRDVFASASRVDRTRPEGVGNEEKNFHI